MGKGRRGVAGRRGQPKQTVHSRLRDHRRTARILGVSKGAQADRSAGEGFGQGAESDRQLRLREVGSPGPQAGAPGRQADPDPPRHARSDRPAAHSRRGGRVPHGLRARCLRQGRGPLARVAALWRAMGAILAGRRPLLRRQAEFHPGGAASECLPLSRLGDRRVQQRHAVRRLRQGANCRRPARFQGSAAISTRAWDITR